MARVVLGILFFITSTTLILVSTLPALSPSIREILGNVGTEIFGILVTIAVVDWYLEKRRRQDRARELAWSVLHEIEYAVWIWQGGPRHMGTNELLGIVTGIQEKDGLAPFSEGLMMNLGLHSRSILQKEPSVIKSLPGLGSVFQDLVSLASLRDLPESTQVRTIAEILESSVMSLARLLGQSTERMPSGLIWHRDSDLEAQGKRYEGVWPNQRTQDGRSSGARGGSGGGLPGQDVGTEG
jgi:hypothetical protein